MICKITWTDTSVLDAQPQEVNFTLRDYYLSYDSTSSYLNCTLMYYFNHTDEVAFENAVLLHNARIDDIELVINQDVSHHYPNFKTIANYIHSLSSSDSIPNIVVQFR